MRKADTYLTNALFRAIYISNYLLHYIIRQKIQDGEKVFLNEQENLTIKPFKTIRTIHPF